MPRTIPLLPVLALVVVALAGCVPGTPAITPPPETTVAPVFASDEEALAAAEEAYRQYITTVDAILADGGADPERLADLVSPELYARELDGFMSYKANGWRGVGSRTFILLFQSRDDQRLVAYSCDDISATDVLDLSDSSVVVPGRQDRYAFEVTFQLNDKLFVVAGKELWDGGGVC